MEKSLVIIDYDAGNLRSVQKAFAFLGQEAKITRDKDTILQADGVVLPGVGSFGDAMEKLHCYGLVEIIREYIASGKPFLGICLGQQLLFEESDETKGVKGLAILPGIIRRIPDTPGLKIPHIGWNSLKIKPQAKLFQGLSDEPYVYFVHSYYLDAANQEDVAATTEYGTVIHASVEHENVFACQFHPEKSGDVGMAILKNFISML